MSEAVSDVMLDKFVSDYHGAQKEFKSTVAVMNQLQGQLQENEQVLQELRLLKEDAVVYKQVGPTLIRQEPEEAKENVGKRIEFIRKEIKRNETICHELTAKQENIQAALMQFSKNAEK